MEIYLYWGVMNGNNFSNAKLTEDFFYRDGINRYIFLLGWSKVEIFFGMIDGDLFYWDGINRDLLYCGCINRDLFQRCCI